MNINNVPSTGGNYTVSYSFEDGVSRTVTASTNDNWITVSVDSSNIYIVISNNNESQRTGNVSVSVDNEVCSSKGIVIKQGGTSPTPTGGFDALLDEFNIVLESRGISRISEAGTSDTYNYLKSMYNATISEYQHDTNRLFDKSNFPDVYDFHGTNNENVENGKSESAMTSWVMASCLSELFPSDNKIDGYNNQTAFFVKAYELGGGSSIGIYDTSEVEHQGYTMKSDPIISRLVASEIYAHERGKYDFDTINDYRNEVMPPSTPGEQGPYGGGITGASEWSELGFSGHNNTGYIVDSSYIIPCSPGPYSILADTGHGYPWEGNYHQPENLFVLTGNTIEGETDDDHRTNGVLVLEEDSTDIDWKYMNYKRDVEIDEYIVKNYNLGSWSHGRNGEIIGFENNSDYDKKVLLLHAAIMPDESIRYFFGNKTLTFCGTTVSTDELCSGFTKYIFAEKGKETVVDPGNLSDTGDTTDYEIEGPFGDLENYMFDAEWNETSTMDYINIVRQIGNQARKATNYVDDGGDIRRRPLGDYKKVPMLNCGADPGEHDNWLGRKGDGGVNGHPLNGIGNGSAQAIFIKDTASAIETFNGDDFPRDPPNSYISGHASQTWMVGLMLAQLFSAIGDDNYAKAKQYLAGAYSVGVGRNIARYHWNSDTLYGRLDATMNLPVINAMDKLNSDYYAAGNALAIREPSEWRVYLHIQNNTGEAIYSTGEIRIYNQDGVGMNVYLPGAKSDAGALYTFNAGPNDFSDLEVHCAVNGGIINDGYDGNSISKIRFYDYRHWSSEDCGYVTSLGSGSDSTFKKSGATYIIEIN